METLGEHLKKNREEKGITLEEIEEVTKISLNYLRAIEEERFEKLPAPIFALGFIKQYARCIGLDPEDIAVRYRVAIQREGISSPQGASGRLWGVRKKAFWILLAAVCGLVLLWVFLSPGKQQKEERIRSIRFPRTTTKELKKEKLRKDMNIGAESKEALLSERPNSTTQPMTDSSKLEKLKTFSGQETVSLTLQAIRKTGVQITIDGKKSEQKILKAGEQFSCHAKKKIQLEIGNGNGIRIFYNGKVYENLGRKGEVVHIVFPPPSP